LAETLMKIARGKVHVRNGAALAEGEALVATIAINAARDLSRREQRRQKRFKEPAETPIDIEDPEAFAAVEQALSPAEMAVALREIERVHPRARSFAEALLNGDTKSEIADAWQVTPSYVSRWFRQHRDDLAEVLHRHLRHAAQRYSYDRRTG
jgi:DNA-directed RNA polymerase specialized sigma24 family protein